MNEELPVNVRVKATDALACSIENTEDLMELYYTQKGKVKNSAICSLAILSPPEADKIWSQMTSKYKRTYCEYMQLSSSKICTDFVVDRLYEEMKNDVDFSTLQIDIEMLANKSGVEQCILDVLNYVNVKYKANPYSIANIKSILKNIVISNLQKYPTPEYRELVKKLFDKDSKTFFECEFFMQLLENPTEMFEKAKKYSLEQRESVLSVIAGLFYCNIDNKYYINFCRGEIVSNLKNAMPIFDIIPESMLEFLADTSYMNVVNSESEKNKEKFKDVVLFATQANQTFRDLLKSSHITSEYERIKNHAVKFALICAEKAPNNLGLNIIGDYYRDGKPEEYKGLYTKYIITSLKIENPISIYFYYYSKFPIPDNDILDEFENILVEIDKLDGKIDKSQVKTARTEIKKVINSLKKK